MMPICFRADTGDVSVLVPPLLFLPLVENIFKHGIDKRSKDTLPISLTLTGADWYSLRETDITHQSEQPGVRDSRTYNSDLNHIMMIAGPSGST